jgi:hypothetical protein
MKRVIFIILTIAIFSCEKEDNPNPESQDYHIVDFNNPDNYTIYGKVSLDGLIKDSLDITLHHPTLGKHSVVTNKEGLFVFRGMPQWTEENDYTDIDVEVIGVKGIERALFNNSYNKPFPVFNNDSIYMEIDAYSINPNTKITGTILTVENKPLTKAWFRFSAPDSEIDNLSVNDYNVIIGRQCNVYDIDTSADESIIYNTQTGGLTIIGVCPNEKRRLDAGYIGGDGTYYYYEDVLDFTTENEIIVNISNSDWSIFEF